MLKYLNENYINSSNKTKIELYLLPFLLIICFFIYFENSKKEDNNIEPKIEINDFSKQKMEENILDISLKLEKIARENDIFISKNEKKEQEIILEFSGEKNNIFLFLENIERLNNYSRIKNLTYKTTKDKKNVFLTIDFKNYFIKRFIEFSKITLKEDIKIDENLTKDNEDEIVEYEIIDFELNAIVGNFAFINGVWLKKNDLINGFKLIKISKDFVILKNESEEVKLELSYAKYSKKLD